MNRPEKTKKTGSSWLRTTCLILIVSGFLASLFTLNTRIQMESASKNVEMVMDYGDLEDLSSQENIPMENLLKRFREKGVSSVALTEMNLDKMENRGQLRWLTGPDLLNMLQISDKKIALSGNISPSAIYIWGYSPETGAALKKNLKLLRAPGSFREFQLSEKNGKNIDFIEIKGKIQEIPFEGIGFDKGLAQKINEQGFNLVLRPENRPNIDPKTIKKFIEDMGYIKGASTIIFGGVNEVVGYPFNMDATVEGFKNTRLSFGDIEVPTPKAKQKGAEYLAQRLLNQTVRVQSIPEMQMDKLLPEDAVDKFRLGVRERNMRMLYIRLYPRGVEEKNILETNLEYVASLKKELNRFGFNIERASLFPLANPSPVAVILISLASVAIFIMLLSFFYEKTDKYGPVILILALMASAGLVFLGKIHVVQKITGLIIGLTVPVYAFAAWFEEIKNIKREKRFSRVFFVSAGAFVKMSLITLAGGIMIAGLFTSTAFMLAVDGFKGVKLLMFLPPVAIILIYYLRGQEKNQTLKEMLSHPLYLWQTIVIAIIGALGAIYIMRTGNTGDAVTTDSERQMRVVLEQFLWVRPRFKDFLIGHPATIMAAALLYLRRYQWLGIFFLLASIGQADIMDTFAHIHTPVFISLVRILMGWGIGAVIGSVILYIYWILNNPKKSDKKGK